MSDPVLALGSALSALLQPPSAIAIVVASLAATPTAPTILETVSVTAVAITGEASSIVLSTRTDRPYRATIDGRRRGWFASWYSSWFFEDCSGTAAMRIDGTTLRVDVSDGGWFDTSDCAVEVEANVPAGAVVSVEQSAFVANLSGRFGGIALAGKAIDAAIEGAARDIDIDGDAVRARIAFDTANGAETVSIDADALDADLSFGEGAAISYRVEATTALVDSALANTPGAKPAVSIKGKFVRATIR